jgi:hypothetical protein
MEYLGELAETVEHQTAVVQNDWVERLQFQRLRGG